MIFHKMKMSKVHTIQKKLTQLVTRLKPLVSRRRLGVAAIFIVLVTSTSVLLPYQIISPYGQYVTSLDSSITTKVGIVFGAGITYEGKPFSELQARLDAAAAAYKAGQIQYILVSGDNRFESYNEPAAMMRYLINESNIDESKIFPDYAGRSTYETCERARKVFQLDKVLLFSAASHLPRAIFTCRSFGLESYGIANNVEANNATRREFLARVKALFNVYIYGEETILGDPIPIP